MEGGREREDSDISWGGFVSRRTRTPSSTACSPSSATTSSSAALRCRSRPPVWAVARPPLPRPASRPAQTASTRRSGVWAGRLDGWPASGLAAVTRRGTPAGLGRAADVPRYAVPGVPRGPPRLLCPHLPSPPVCRARSGRARDAPAARRPAAPRYTTLPWPLTRRRRRRTTSCSTRPRSSR